MHRLDDLLPIGEAAKLRGVSVDTIRRWEKKGKLRAELTEGGHRRFKVADLRQEETHQTRRGGDALLHRCGGGLRCPPIGSHQICDLMGEDDPWGLSPRTRGTGHIPLRVLVSPLKRVIRLKLITLTCVLLFAMDV